MNKERVAYFAHISVGIIALGIMFLVFAKHIFPVILPFLIAWVMAMAASTPAERLARKTGIPEKLTRLMTSLFLTLAIFSALALIIWQATGAVWRFLTDIGEGDKIYEILSAISSPSLPIFGDGFPEELAARISEAIRSIISSALSGLASAVTSFVGEIPRVLLFLLVTVISLVYFSLDLERINALIKRILPAPVAEALSLVKSRIFTVGKKYIGSYLLLMLITFGTVLTGFLILGVGRSALVALFVAVLDILPVIGVGTVLLPWSIFSFATGDHYRGIGLLVIFVVNTVVRQFVEPRLVGKTLNMHPVASLAMIYIGYALFGLSGLLLFPMIAVTVGCLFGKNDAAEIT